MKSLDCALPIQSVEYVFCSAPSIPLSTDYSTAPYEEEEVNSPPPQTRVVPEASPSPLRPRRIMGSPRNIGGRVIMGKIIVYDAKAPPVIPHHSLVSDPPAPSPIALS